MSLRHSPNHHPIHPTAPVFAFPSDSSPFHVTEERGFRGVSSDSAAGTAPAAEPGLETIRPADDAREPLGGSGDMVGSPPPEAARVPPASSRVPPRAPRAVGEATSARMLPVLPVLTTTVERAPAVAPPARDREVAAAPAVPPDRHREISSPDGPASTDQVLGCATGDQMKARTDRTEELQAAAAHPARHPFRAMHAAALLAVSGEHRKPVPGEISLWSQADTGNTTGHQPNVRPDSMVAPASGPNAGIGRDIVPNTNPDSDTRQHLEVRQSASDKPPAPAHGTPSAPGRLPDRTGRAESEAEGLRSGDEVQLDHGRGNEKSDIVTSSGAPAELVSPADSRALKEAEEDGQLPPIGNGDWAFEYDRRPEAGATKEIPPGPYTNAFRRHRVPRAAPGHEMEWHDIEHEPGHLKIFGSPLAAKMISEAATYASTNLHLQRQFTGAMDSLSAAMSDLLDVSLRMPKIDFVVEIYHAVDRLLALVAEAELAGQPTIYPDEMTQRYSERFAEIWHSIGLPKSRGSISRHAWPEDTPINLEQGQHTTEIIEANARPIDIAPSKAWLDSIKAQLRAGYKPIIGNGYTFVDVPRSEDQRSLISDDEFTALFSRREVPVVIRNGGDHAPFYILMLRNPLMADVVCGAATYASSSHKLQTRFTEAIDNLGDAIYGIWNQPSRHSSEEYYSVLKGHRYLHDIFALYTEGQLAANPWDNLPLHRRAIEGTAEHYDEQFAKLWRTSGLAGRLVTLANIGIRAPEHLYYQGDLSKRRWL